MVESKIMWVPPGGLTPHQTNRLAELFAGVAGDFVPPLTQRTGTAQAGLRNLEPSRAENGDYFEEMLAQHLILSWRKGLLAGFLSFRASYADPRFPDVSPCLYVSTIAVRHSQRRNGIARELYDCLFNLPATPAPWVLLRTWSTNGGHLRLLSELGFATVLTLHDDRSDGVDTVYLAAPRA